MKFYKNLYLSNGCVDKKEKICWKLKHNAGQIDIFVIGLAPGRDLLEIYHCGFLQQKAFKKNASLIVGIADGYDLAVELTVKIIEDVYAETGNLLVKEYILHKQSQNRGR